LIGQTINQKMKKKINKINNIFFKLLLLNIFLFSPSIGLSEAFDYQKPLIILKKKLKNLKKNYMLTKKYLQKI
jgi:hypothetical protein